MPIIVDKVTYKYSPGTAFETTALDEVSVTINDGEFIALMGHTGSGKSTFVQHLNGLLKATSGHIYYDGEDIYSKGYDLKELRTRVGMVFQYPEHQLFENTVFDDVKFGPQNQGLTDKEASLRAYEALDMVEFPKDLFGQSPFNLSGGQRRLAAIAGVLAMKPAILILDEPTAGLDPKGKTQILNLLKRLHTKTKRTIILVSHNMEDIAKYAERVIVINDGRIVLDDATRAVFSHTDELESMGLSVPEVTYMIKELAALGVGAGSTVLNEDEAVRAIINSLGQRDKDA